VNVFVGPERAGDVLDALPKDVTVLPRHRAAAARAGQVRVLWEDSPIDLFLDVHELHAEAAGSVVVVPFERATIPVLACRVLLLLKAIYNRTRDWADIEAMLDAGAVDGPAALDRLRRVIGPADPIVGRLASLVRS
jgi:hypothetical protein